MYKIFFLGTPDIAARFLALIEPQRGRLFTLLRLYTQPDRAVRRGKRLETPVKQWAHAHGLGGCCFSPQRLRDQEITEDILAQQPHFLVTFAYGQILSQAWLDLPTIAPLNLHTSLLPRYRGAAPIQRALWDGCHTSGVSLMRMDRGMDTGPVYLQKECTIAGLTAGEVEACMAKDAAALFLHYLENVESISSQPQQEDGVSYAPKIEADATQINWNHTTQQLCQQVMALSPRPGAYCYGTIRGVRKRIKILRARTAQRTLARGQVLWDRGLFIGCAQGALEVLELQIEGKACMSAEQFQCGVGVTFFLEWTP